jgi:hypothetical protein
VVGTQRKELDIRYHNELTVTGVKSLQDLGRIKAIAARVLPEKSSDPCWRITKVLAANVNSQLRQQHLDDGLQRVDWCTLFLSAQERMN